MTCGELKQIAISLVLAGALFVSGCGYNDLQGLDEDTKAAWSEVINQYQRRAEGRQFGGDNRSVAPPSAWSLRLHARRDRLVHSADRR